MSFGSATPTAKTDPIADPTARAVDVQTSEDLAKKENTRRIKGQFNRGKTNNLFAPNTNINNTKTILG